MMSMMMRISLLAFAVYMLKIVRSVRLFSGLIKPFSIRPPDIVIGGLKFNCDSIFYLSSIFYLPFLVSYPIRCH